MNIGTLTAFLRTDRSDFDSGLDGAGDKMRDTGERVGSESERMGDRVSVNWGKVTAAGVAAGAGAEAFARGQAESNQALARASVTTGESEDSLRSMISAMADGTTSAPELAGSLDRLNQAGVSTREGMEAVLPAMSEFSTATGKDLPKSIDVFDRALSALGIPMEEANEHLDTMTFMSEQTTVPLSNLSQLMRREAPAMKEMGLSLDDVAVAMSALEAEGIRGPRAVMGFQSAIKEADGSVEAFWENLNVSNDTLEAQRGQLAESTGLTEQLAEANESAITPMQRLSQWTENLMFEHGHLAEAASLLAIPLMALGPIAKGVAVAYNLLGNAALIKGAKMAAGWIMAMGPIGWIIAIVLALVALIIANWDTISEWTEAAWTRVSDAVGRGIEWARDRVDAGVERVRSIISWFRELPGLVGGWFMGMALAAGERITQLIGFVASLPGRALSALGDLGSYLLGAGHSLIMGFWNGLTSAWDWVVGQFRGMLSGLRDMLPFSPAKTGPFSGRGYTLYSGRALMKDFARGITAEEGAITGALDHALTAGQDQVRGTSLGGRIRGGDGADSDALYRAVRDAMDGSRMSIDGRGVSRLVNRRNRSDRRRGGGLAPALT